MNEENGLLLVYSLKTLPLWTLMNLKCLSTKSCLVKCICILTYHYFTKNKQIYILFHGLHNIFWSKIDFMNTTNIFMLFHVRKKETWHHNTRIKGWGVKIENAVTPSVCYETKPLNSISMWILYGNWVHWTSLTSVLSSLLSMIWIIIRIAASLLNARWTISRKRMEFLTKVIDQTNCHLDSHEITTTVLRALRVHSRGLLIELLDRWYNFVITATDVTKTFPHLRILTVRFSIAELVTILAGRHRAENDRLARRVKLQTDWLNRVIEIGPSFLKQPVLDSSNGLT